MKTRMSLPSALLATLLLATAQPATSQASEELRTMQAFLDLLDSYFELVEARHTVHSDPGKAVIVKLQKIQEIHDERGRKADAAEVFRSVLDRSTDPMVRSITATMLADNLKDTGQHDEALTVLRDALDESLAAKND